MGSSRLPNKVSLEERSLYTQPRVEQPPGEAVLSLNRWARKAWWLSVLPLLLFFIIPIIVLITQTNPDRILASLSDPQVYQAIGVSLKTTAISLGLILVLGTPVGFALGRYNFGLKKFIETLVDMPTVLPPSVAGMVLLLAFGRNGVIGSLLSHWGVSLAFTQAAVIMAQLFIASPFYIRAASVGFASINDELIDSAQMDGANGWNIFRYILVPLSRSALIGGGLLSWARSLGEFGATIMFAGNFMGRTQTMPLAIYLGFETDLEAAITLSVILVVISFLTLLLLRLFIARTDQ